MDWLSTITSSPVTGRWGSLTVTSATVEPMINACFNFISSHESYFYMVQYKHCCL